MISKSRIEIIARNYGTRSITAIYKGLRLVWESLASCFGSGTWHSDETWNGDDLWLND